VDRDERVAVHKNLREGERVDMKRTAGAWGGGKTKGAEVLERDLRP